MDIKYPGVVLAPALRGRDPQILNISMAAADKLHMGNEEITCNMRVGGTPCAIVLPIESILAIFSPDAPANGMAMSFAPAHLAEAEGVAAQEVDVVTPAADNAEPEVKKTKPSFLTVVK